MIDFAKLLAASDPPLSTDGNAARDEHGHLSRNDVRTYRNLIGSPSPSLAEALRPPRTPTFDRPRRRRTSGRSRPVVQRSVPSEPPEPAPRQPNLRDLWSDTPEPPRGHPRPADEKELGPEASGVHDLPRDQPADDTAPEPEPEPTTLPTESEPWPRAEAPDPHPADRAIAEPLATDERGRRTSAIRGRRRRVGAALLLAIALGASAIAVIGAQGAASRALAALAGLVLIVVAVLAARGGMLDK